MGTQVSVRTLNEQQRTQHVKDLQALDRVEPMLRIALALERIAEVLDGVDAVGWSAEGRSIKEYIDGEWPLVVSPAAEPEQD